MAGLQLQITGQGSGRILILIPLADGLSLPPCPAGGSGGAAAAHGDGAVRYPGGGNIIASSFLSELGDLLGRRLLPSSPEIHIENIPQLVRDVTTSLRASGSELLVIQGAIEDGEHQPRAASSSCRRPPPWSRSRVALRGIGRGFR